MLKKEFSEIWLPVLIRLGVAMILPVGAFMLKREFDAGVALILLMGLFVAIIWIANALGVSAFKAEKNDRAWEYLFTFPYGRLRLMAYKVVPRALVLIGLLGLYSLIISVVDPLFKDSKTREIFRPWPLYMISLVLLVSGLSLSIFNLKNLRILTGLPWFLFFQFSCYGVSRLIRHLGMDRETRAPLILGVGALIVAAITGNAFWRVFRRFDLQGESVHMRRYLVLTMPPALLIFVAVLFMIVRW